MGAQLPHRHRTEAGVRQLLEDVGHGGAHRHLTALDRAREQHPGQRLGHRADLETGLGVGADERDPGSGRCVLLDHGRGDATRPTSGQGPKPGRELRIAVDMGSGPGHRREPAARNRQQRREHDGADQAHHTRAVICTSPGFHAAAGPDQQGTHRATGQADARWTIPLRCRSDGLGDAIVSLTDPAPRHS